MKLALLGREGLFGRGRWRWRWVCHWWVECRGLRERRRRLWLEELGEDSPLGEKRMEGVRVWELVWFDGHRARMR